MVNSEFVCRCGKRVGCSPICAECQERLVSDGMAVVHRLLAGRRCIACSHLEVAHDPETGCQGVFDDMDPPSKVVGNRCWCADFQPPAPGARGGEREG